MTKQIRPFIILNNDYIKKVVNDMPALSDLQYKDELRKELDILERRLELLKSQKYAELQKELETDINRINKSLQD